jgi:hypothetical protein
MRKLITIEDEGLSLHCDNDKCVYDLDVQGPKEDFHKWIDAPCPMCGESLLTVYDYALWVKTGKVIDWINKWFSWLTWFIPKDAKQTTVSVETHEKIKITVLPE